MRKRIGEFLLEKGVIKPTQVNQILKYSQEHGVRFGVAALELGFVTREQLVQVFGPSFAVDFFYLESEYYPKITQALLPVEMLVRLGALPLGFKTERKFFRTKKMLNVGLLEPARKEAAEEILRFASAKLGENEVQGVTVFLILADQFLRVLKDVYQVSDLDLRGKEHSQMDGTLSMFLDHAH